MLARIKISASAFFQYLADFRQPFGLRSIFRRFWTIAYIRRNKNKCQHYNNKITFFHNTDLPLLKFNAFIIILDRKKNRGVIKKAKIISCWVELSWVEQFIFIIAHKTKFRFVHFILHYYYTLKSLKVPSPRLFFAKKMKKSGRF